MSKVIIIGGGASGLVAAITAKRNNHEVILLERNSICGKKILLTGNGHCNYYNSNQDLKHYHSNNNELIAKIITKENLDEVLTFFNSIGIIPRIKDGYYYPYSNQAVSIQNALLTEAKNLNIEIENNIYIEEILYSNNEYTIIAGTKTYKTPNLIIATGSSAAPKTGSDGNGYHLVEKLGHNIIKPLPALVQLNTTGNFLKEWSGVRADVSIKLLENNIKKREEKGEILLTNYGISGICVMQLSTLVARGLENNKQEEVIINFLKEFANTRQEFIELLNKRHQLMPNRNISELLDSVLNYKLVNTLIKISNIKTSKKWNQLNAREKSILASNFIELRLNITSTNSFQKAQAASGGVPLTEINLQTMESKILKNLYLTGEILDIVGDCGGYNLTFAWISGQLAGKLGAKND